jgi:hypothetical protein
MRFRAFISSLLLSICGVTLSPQQLPPREPRELLTALNHLQVDPAAAYKIDPADRIELRRGDAKLLFEDGFLVFFSPFDGKVTGAVFTGRGHILATPRDPVEKQQLAHFLGAPVLDQEFTTAYLRFTDAAADELINELQIAKVTAQTNSPLADAWQAAVLARNPEYSFRLLSETFSKAPRPFFSATLGGVSAGQFEFVYDLARDEPQSFAQTKKSAGLEFYDVWASYGSANAVHLSLPFRALHYEIETSVHADNSVTGQAKIRLRAERSGERLVAFQLSRSLTTETATLAGEPLFTFPDSSTPAEERGALGSDRVFVLLPHAVNLGDELELSFRYRGNVIRDAGNGVLFVGERENWYPHLGDTAAFSSYELTFHWPRKLRLAATGVKTDEHEEGDVRTGHWHTERPASVAGFNLGEYAFASLASSGYTIDVYANRQLEQALLDRLRQPGTDLMEIAPRALGARPGERFSLPLPDPRPADALKQLARDIDSSIRFYQAYLGPFPVRQLSVSQIPGTFGQGWPGLLYLSTYSFLPADVQGRAGLSASGQEHFHDLVPFHEVAHQWWGNVVGWSSYRDQWINEALATYLSLLCADNQKSPDHRLRVWLDRFRKRLVEKSTDEMAPADIGAVVLGSRLSSSRSPDGFDQVVYGKGAWIFHMLREMLREPSAKNPDTRFMTLLNTLQTKYAYRALSTDDLQHEIESVMTPAMGIEGHRSMEWFFADWVRGTGIPHYRVEYSVKRSEKGFIVKGKLLQSAVANSFVAPVPIYSSNGGYLGRIIAGGPETLFHFVTPREPGKLLIDPQMTLLCIVDR